MVSFNSRNFQMGIKAGRPTLFTYLKSDSNRLPEWNFQMYNSYEKIKIYLDEKYYDILTVHGNRNLKDFYASNQMDKGSGQSLII